MEESSSPLSSSPCRCHCRCNHRTAFVPSDLPLRHDHDCWITSPPISSHAAGRLGQRGRGKESTLWSTRLNSYSLSHVRQKVTNRRREEGELYIEPRQRFNPRVIRIFG